MAKRKQLARSSNIAIGLAPADKHYRVSEYSKGVMLEWWYVVDNIANCVQLDFTYNATLELDPVNSKVGKVVRGIITGAVYRDSVINALNNMLTMVAYLESQGYDDGCGGKVKKSWQAKLAKAEAAYAVEYKAYSQKLKSAK